MENNKNFHLPSCPGVQNYGSVADYSANTYSCHNIATTLVQHIYIVAMLWQRYVIAGYIFTIKTMRNAHYMHNCELMTIEPNPLFRKQWFALMKRKM